MAKLCNAAPAFFFAQSLGTGRNFTRPVVTRRLQSLLCCAARALFRLKSVIVVGAKQVLTGPSNPERSSRAIVIRLIMIIGRVRSNCRRVYVYPALKMLLSR
jgi:hypothetical protein